MNAADVTIGMWADMLEAALHRFSVRYSDAKWRQYTAGDASDLPALEVVREEIYGSQELFDRVTAWRGQVSDPLLARRVDLLALDLLDERVRSDAEVSRLTNELSTIHLEHRAVFEGKQTSDAALRDVLRFEKDRARREAAWRARVGVGAQLASGLSRLVRLRNELARRHGYSDFYALRMHLEGLDPQTVADLTARLDALTREPYRRFVASLTTHLGIFELQPWDVAFDYRDVHRRLRTRFPKERLFPLLKETFAGMGLPLDDLPITWDLDERPGKTQHAFCFGVDVPVDIRVLANLVDGLPSYRTLFHEVGHAVYDATIDQPSFILRGPPNGSFAEASAQLFAFVLDRPAWLEGALGLTRAEAAALLASERERNIVNVRNYLAWMAFERSLYQDPDADPTAAWWALEERFMEVEGGHDEAAWAQIIHFTTHPVYLQNYLVADVIAAQVTHELERSVGGELLGCPDVGRLLKDRIFRHGSARSSSELLRQGTGADLDPVHFIESRLGLGSSR